MKTKLFTVIAVVMLSVAALQAQVSFGVVAGPNFQNMTGKDSNGDKLENGLIVGFHAGVKANVPIATDFFFQTGLLYSCKGSKNDFFRPAKSTSSELNTTTRIGYIELPLNLIFRPAFADGHILIGFGPYVAYGIGGS
ncbi:MAG: outer membrane beta-barrel protein, partial [Bacteroidales bacterium]